MTSEHIDALTDEVRIEAYPPVDILDSIEELTRRFRAKDRDTTDADTQAFHEAMEAYDNVMGVGAGDDAVAICAEARLKIADVMKLFPAKDV